MFTISAQSIDIFVRTEHSGVFVTEWHVHFLLFFGLESNFAIAGRETTDYAEAVPRRGCHNWMLFWHTTHRAWHDAANAAQPQPQCDELMGTFYEYQWLAQLLSRLFIFTRCVSEYNATCSTLQPPLTHNNNNNNNKYWIVIDPPSATHVSCAI